MISAINMHFHSLNKQNFFMPLTSLIISLAFYNLSCREMKHNFLFNEEQKLADQAILKKKIIKNWHKNAVAKMVFHGSLASLLAFYI